MCFREAIPLVPKWMKFSLLIKKILILDTRQSEQDYLTTFAKTMNYLANPMQKDHHNSGHSYLEGPQAYLYL